MAELNLEKLILAKLYWIVVNSLSLQSMDYSNKLLSNMRYCDSVRFALSAFLGVILSKSEIESDCW